MIAEMMAVGTRVERNPDSELDASLGFSGSSYRRSVSSICKSLRGYCQAQGNGEGEETNALCEDIESVHCGEDLDDTRASEWWERERQAVLLLQCRCDGRRSVGVGSRARSS